MDVEAFVRDGYVAVRGVALDGSDPSPVARAIVRGLELAQAG